MGTVTLVSVVAALADLAGGWLTLRISRAQAEMDHLIALGAGFLLGSAFLMMLPAAMGEPDGAIAVALGFAGFLLLRTTAQRLPWSGRLLRGESVSAALVGMLLHSFLEGVTLGLAVRAGGAIGLMALAAMLLHKVSEGFSITAVVLSGTGSERLALAASALVGAVTVVGAWAVYGWTEVAALPQGAILGVAAGSFLYVGAAEMLPHALKRRSSPWLLFVGMLVVYLLMGSGHQHHPPR